MTTPHRVVVIGSGFGGLFGTQALRRRQDVEVTLIAPTAHHLFQPLLYQVATGILSEGEIAPSTREVLARQKNARVVLGAVTHVDLEARTVTSRVLGRDSVTPYDSLLVAAGAGQSWFGNDQFARHAPGMKSIDDALELRGRIFGAFELAELAQTPAEAERALTFVVVGAGPTGVEMAGQIAELANRTLKNDFRRIDPTQARIILVDAVDTVLPSFGERLGGAARRRLSRHGRRRAPGDQGHRRRRHRHHRHRARRRLDPDRGPHQGVGGRRAGQPPGPADRRAVRGRRRPRRPGAGAARPHRARSPRGVRRRRHDGARRAPGGRAGRHPGRALRREADHPPARRQAPLEPRFEYLDKGSMATISRFSAVASIGRLRFSGFFAWVLWLAIHLVYIIGFKHRVTTLLHWAVSFLGRGRSERVATEQQVFGRHAIDVLPHGELPYIPTDPADGEVSGVAELEDRRRRTA